MISEKPLPYTANPIELLVGDVLLFFRLSLTWPGLLSIIWPTRPCPSRDLDELALTWENAWATLVHTFLFFGQLTVLIAAVVSPFLLIVPVPVYIGCLALSVKVNQWLCNLLLNGGPEQTYWAGSAYAENPWARGDRWVSSKHPDERWVFVNGVAVGSHWMNSNLTRLSATFRRPILGIHNPTYGIIFDVLECIIQRTFNYATRDIRIAYDTVAELLQDSKVKKVVLIAHSQGSIETGMVLDWVYATLLPTDVEKLEVFTFGNAANHWNCPEQSNEDGKKKVAADGQIVVEKKRLIRHMEHYVNRHDWVARFGVMFYRGMEESGTAAASATDSGELLKRAATGEPDTVLENRFVGKMFIRDASGHQFNQHYLDHFFPTKKGINGTPEVDEHAEYMNKQIDPMALDLGRVVLRDRKLPAPKANGVNGAGAPPVAKGQSRLWTYRNGGVPDSE